MPPSRPRNDLSFLIEHVDSEEMLSSTISGNAPLFIKEAAVRWFIIIDGGVGGGEDGSAGVRTFGQFVRRRLELRDISLEASPDDPMKISIRMECELDVRPDMCDDKGLLSTGCMTCLIDEGSAISLLLLRINNADLENENIGVSQTLNFLFHHPPPPSGSKIKIISRSVSAQSDIGCGQCEIWDVKNHKLIISGQQLQMQPTAFQHTESKL